MSDELLPLEPIVGQVYCTRDEWVDSNVLYKPYSGCTIQVQTVQPAGGPRVSCPTRRAPTRAPFTPWWRTNLWLAYSEVVVGCAAHALGFVGDFIFSKDGHVWELVSHHTLEVAVPDCPGCGKKAAPEHVTDTSVKCWWCTRTWSL